VQNDRRIYGRPREPENIPQAGGRSPDRQRWDISFGKLPMFQSHSGESRNPEELKTLIQFFGPDVGGRIRRKYGGFTRRLCGGPPVLERHSGESHMPAGWVVNPEYRIQAYGGMKVYGYDISLSTFKKYIIWDNLLHEYSSIGNSEEVIQLIRSKVNRCISGTLTDVTRPWFVIGEPHTAVNECDGTAVLHSTGSAANRRVYMWYSRFSYDRRSGARFTALERSLLLLSDHARYRSDEESHLVNGLRSKNVVSLLARRTSGEEHDSLKSYLKAKKT
jgi:hypothetical protein